MGVQQVAAAYEKEAVEDAVLMFCKHCLRYSMGWCPIHQRVRSPYKEPYYLVSNDGKRFRLEFDCKNCQMKVKSGSMRIIIHNFHHSFHHRGRRGHRGYSGGNIFTHSSDTDCFECFLEKSVESFSLYLLSPFYPLYTFLSSVSSSVLCGEK